MKHSIHKRGCRGIVMTGNKVPLIFIRIWRTIQEQQEAYTKHLSDNGRDSQTVEQD
jgi:hypothetical protein